MDLCVYLYICNMDMRRAWRLTPGFLPGESHGHMRLPAYRPQSCKKFDTTDTTQRACSVETCVHTYTLCVCVYLHINTYIQRQRQSKR